MRRNSANNRERAERQRAPRRADRHAEVRHLSVLDVIYPAVDVNLGAAFRRRGEGRRRRAGAEARRGSGTRSGRYGGEGCKGGVVGRGEAGAGEQL